MPEITNDAREASMSRVTTLDNLNPAATTSPASVETEKSEQLEEGQKPARKPINERITQLVGQRREAEAKAEAAESRARELQARLEALQSKPAPIEAGDEPKRTQFVSDDDYIDARADWKAKQVLANREKAQTEAQQKAEFEAVTKSWEKRIDKAKKDMPDFEDVVGGAEIEISSVIHQALLRHEEGPSLAYLLAKHPEEATKVNRMHPIDAVRYLDRLARDLTADEVPEQKPTQRSKAPAPIVPVRAVSAADPGAPQDFATYRARRQQERSDKR